MKIKVTEEQKRNILLYQDKLLINYNNDILLYTNVEFKTERVDIPKIRFFREAKKKYITHLTNCKLLYPELNEDCIYNLIEDSIYTLLIKNNHILHSNRKRFIQINKKIELLKNWKEERK